VKKKRITKTSHAFGPIFVLNTLDFLIHGLIQQLIPYVYFRFQFGPLDYVWIDGMKWSGAECYLMEWSETGGVQVPSIYYISIYSPFEER
jgi:hypothetical protein